MRTRWHGSLARSFMGTSGTAWKTSQCSQLCVLFCDVLHWVCAYHCAWGMCSSDGWGGLLLQGIGGDVLVEESGPRDTGHQEKDGETVTGVHKAWWEWEKVCVCVCVYIIPWQLKLTVGTLPCVPSPNIHSNICSGRIAPSGTGVSKLLASFDKMVWHQSKSCYDNVCLRQQISVSQEMTESSFN